MPCGDSHTPDRTARWGGGAGPSASGPRSSGGADPQDVVGSVSDLPHSCLFLPIQPKVFQTPEPRGVLGKAHGGTADKRFPPPGDGSVLPPSNRVGAALWLLPVGAGTVVSAGTGSSAPGSPGPVNVRPQTDTVCRHPPGPVCSAGPDPSMGEAGRRAPALRSPVGKHHTSPAGSVVA